MRAISPAAKDRAAGLQTGSPRNDLCFLGWKTGGTECLPALRDLVVS